MYRYVYQRKNFVDASKTIKFTEIVVLKSLGYMLMFVLYWPTQ